MFDLDRIFEDDPPIDEEPPTKKRWTDLSTVFHKFEKKETQRRRRNPDRSVQEMINVLQRNNRKEEAELMDENRGEIISWLKGIEQVPEPAELEKFFKKASDIRMSSEDLNPDNLPTWVKLSEVIYLAAHNTFEEDDYVKIDYKSPLRKFIAESVRKTMWRRSVEMQKQKNQHDQLLEERYWKERQQRQQLMAEANQKEPEEEEILDCSPKRNKELDQNYLMLALREGSLHTEGNHANILQKTPESRLGQDLQQPSIFFEDPNFEIRTGLDSDIVFEGEVVAEKENWDQIKKRLDEALLKKKKELMDMKAKLGQFYAVERAKMKIQAQLSFYCPELSRNNHHNNAKPRRFDDPK